MDNLSLGGSGGELRRSSSGIELGPILSLGGKGGGGTAASPRIQTSD